jgi:3-oxoacyl-[acyl-carrier protein] reductase
MAERTVVVTGGGTGIGKAIAAAFAADGEQVVILGRREEVLREAAEELEGQAPKATVRWKTCDVSEPDEVDRFVAWLIEEVSPTVDVLVNNAGGTGSVDPSAPTAEAAAYARNMLSANLVGVYIMVHALRPHLRRPGGRIVNISSIAAFRGGGVNGGWVFGR